MGYNRQYSLRLRPIIVKYHLFVWLKVTTSFSHVLLNIERAFFVRWYINRHWFSSRHLSMYTWHGPKCNSLSSFSYCKEYLYGINIFIPTLPSLWGLLLWHLIKFRLSLAATSPSFVFSCYAVLRSLSAFILVRSSTCRRSRLLVLGR